MDRKIMFGRWNCFGLLAGVVLMLLSASNASAQQLADNEPITQKFINIKGSQFNFFALKSRDVLKNYSKVRYFPMSSKTLVLKKSGDNDIDRSWKKATAEDWLSFTTIFDQMVPKYFPGDKLFALTDQAGPDVLSVQFRLAEYTPRVHRKGELGQTTIGHQEVRSYGEVLVVIMLVDSLTNEVVGIASDGIALGAGSLLAKSSSVSSQQIGWQRAYDIWLTKLREQLDISHSAQG